MDIIQLVKNFQSVLIVGHIKPDGDCFGSGLALLRLCENLEKKASFVCDSELSLAYSFMNGFEKVNVFDGQTPELVIAVDCGDESRMGKYREYLKKAKKSVNIDHHSTNNGFADVNIIERDYSSTCQLVFELLDKGSTIDSVMASCLYVGLSTDTGHFVHNTTTAKVFRVAARLIELGADACSISDKLYKNRSLNKTRLIARAIESLRFFSDNTVAIVSILDKDFADCNCTLSDTEGLIDYASSIAGVKISACIAQQKPHVFKISLRSKGADVSRVAASFGGGGHVRAAGCVLNGFYEDVIRKLERAISCELERELV